MSDLLDSIDDFDPDIDSYREYAESAAIRNGVVRARARFLARYLDHLGRSDLATDLRGMELEEVGILVYLQSLRERFVPEARRAARSDPQ